MKYLLIALLFCSIVFSGCYRRQISTKEIFDSSDTISTVYKNGTIVSEGVIPFECASSATVANEGYLTGIEVKLDDGKVIPVYSADLKPADIKRYKLKKGEKVSCAEVLMAFDKKWQPENTFYMYHLVLMAK